ncbi:MAG: helix-turn-helix domain-containing protein [Clostridia bacterium]|nr:helix-turn-helix domain-containing protein [Clostridia bacterium]
MDNNLGNNIRTFRKNKGFTQEELADLLNVTPQAVSRWESAVGMPDVSMLIPLAQTLGVSTDALLGYDMLREDDEVTQRIKDTVSGMWDDKDRAGSKLKICEYLSTETNIHPGNYEIINEYTQQAASLSMYWDDKLEGLFRDQTEHIMSLFKDCIKKGTYLISHCNDRVLVEKTHYAIAWIYIHTREFDKAREHINVLPEITSTRNREVLEMESVFFDRGFDAMKDEIDKKNVLMFSALARQLYSISQSYGWWGKKDDAVEMCSWIDKILESYATRPEAIDKKFYLNVKMMNVFHKTVALNKAGEEALAKDVYDEFINDLNSKDYISDELKKETIETLDHEISYYAKYT